MAEITTLPRWKKGATAYERLSELALMAKEHPEKFSKFCIVYMEVLPNGRWRFKTFEHEATLIEAIGLYELAGDQLHQDSQA